MAKKPRNYKDEYKKFQASKASKLDRAARNKARREAEKDGKVSKFDGMDIDHKNSNPRDGRKSNLRVVKKSTNRGKIEDSRKKGSKRKKK